MADYTLEINENMIYGILDDQVVRGLEDLGNSVAEMARTLAPVGKRTRAKPRDLKLEIRKVESRPVGKHDYVRPELNGKPYALDADVHQYVMSELRKHESALYEVRAIVPSLSRKGKTTDYPLMNARAMTKPTGRMKEAGREPITDRIIREPEMATTKLVTGPHLKDSIYVEMLEAEQAVWTIQIVADRPYAFYVEKGLGPGKREPAHFMEGALAAHAEMIESGDILKR